ncbi:hypothetical protein [Ectopseudomonas guguanensis]|uniref:hypothetical protein n=1 Tax=Ectopseudomonas guguanensis TaxID=1198456 RepID=UPI0028B0E3FB|nr:hypothetical protein [Pseudomonas guguanensis]
MPRCKDSATLRDKPEDLMGWIGRHMPYRHQLMYEWPYVAGATCLVVLLVWQPFKPAAIFPPSGTQNAQRSLQEIDTNCYQVRSQAPSDQPCENCGKDKVTSAGPEQDFQFSRSIFTCRDVQHAPLRSRAAERPSNMMIEVIRSNHSF